MPVDPSRVKAIFMAALEKSAGQERAAYVEEACAGNAVVRERVEALLKAHDDPTSFMGTPAGAALGATDDFHASECDDATTSGDSPSFDAILATLRPYLSPSNRTGALGRLAHYDVLEVLGRGAFGVVLKAFDDKLHRIVAIKLLAPELAANGTARQRFLREARAVAAIRHEHVIDIHAVDEQPLPYLVMECIDGQTLQQKIDATGPLDAKEILRIGYQIASGLAAAHTQGQIHRDIKPSNILLENGVERVKISDFGLARTVDDGSLSQAGLILGTPMYMAPEQASGQPIDHRADLFSLGSTLYAMCTGRPPFRGASTIGVLQRVINDQPRPIRDVNPAIPEWLCELIVRLHAKQPADRFQTAAEVADVLAKHLAELQLHGTVRAATPVAATRSARSLWPAAAALLLCLGGFSLTEATGMTQLAGTVIRIVTGEGTLVIDVEDPSVKVSLDGEELTIRGGGVQEVRVRPGQYQFTATKDGRPVKQELVSITRGGRKVVTVSREVVGSADVSAIRPRAVLQAHSGSVLSLAFLEDGNKLATGSSDRSVIVWDSDAGTLRTQFHVHDGDVMRMAVSPEEKYLVTASGDERARVWDTLAGKLQTDFSGNKGWLISLAVSPQRNSVATGSGVDQVVKVWDLMTGEVRATLPPHNWSDPWALAFSPDGQTLAAGYSDGQLVLWDIARQERRATVSAHAESIREIVYSPDGSMLATVSYDKTAKIWDPNTLEIKHTLRGCRERILSAAFTPDDRTLVTAGGDWDWADKRVSKKAGELMLWDVETGRPLPAAIESPPGAILCVRVAPGGKTLATAHADGAARLWNMDVLMPQRAARDSAARAISQAFVLLGGEGIPERRFDTLAEAMQNAGDGDTIEIRGNGPFDTEPITIRNRSLVPVRKFVSRVRV